VSFCPQALAGWRAAADGIDFSLGRAGARHDFRFAVHMLQGNI
jgi:hypothetical protein